MDPAYSGPERKARGARVGVGRRLPDFEAQVQEDPFFCGYRWVGDEQVPLTEDDLLDPQEGDYVSEHTSHQWVVRKGDLPAGRGRGVLRGRLAGEALGAGRPPSA